MKAQQMIEGATFDDKQLKAIKKAFDNAWDQISHQISKRPDAIEASRMKLATVVLSIAKAASWTPSSSGTRRSD